MSLALIYRGEKSPSPPPAGVHECRFGERAREG
ncbi:hypothetical protein QFZ99_005074 [Paraburkholderia atlantica]|uniref:Uncharacterized protein n=1 Tax=Paraburkholderia atlantica TaxID=2654982 RepID=A0A7W8Q3Q6_PARAM|nr:hypothetical protein [Paraburkholderia atlantica]